MQFVIYFFSIKIKLMLWAMFYCTFLQYQIFFSFQNFEQHKLFKLNYYNWSVDLIDVQCSPFSMVLWNISGTIRDTALRFSSDFFLYKNNDEANKSAMYRSYTSSTLDASLSFNSKNTLNFDLKFWGYILE